VRGANAVKNGAGHRLIQLQVIQIGPLRIEGGARFFVHASEVRLGSLERRLLMQVVARRGQICLSQDLLGAARNPKHRRGLASVQTRVTRLRRKLGPAGRLLETVWGLGYRLSTSQPLRERTHHRRARPF
jgi:DNA-binding response OmpR family regulator